MQMYVKTDLCLQQYIITICYLINIKKQTKTYTNSKQCSVEMLWAISRHTVAIETQIAWGIAIWYQVSKDQMDLTGMIWN